MFPSFGRRRVAPVCLGPPSIDRADDGLDSSKSTLVHTGEMVMKPDSQNQRLRRPSIDVVQQHLKNSDRSSNSYMLSGQPVTKQNAKQHMLVVRGPHWKWGNDDGGPGKLGRILCVDKKSGTITVFWHQTDHVHSYYRCGRYSDLSLAVSDSCRQCCAGSLDSASDEDGQSSPKAQSSTLPRLVNTSPKRNSILSVLSIGSDSHVLSVSSRRSSQDLFATAAQTFIVFDWDDTLFPTTYFSKGLGLNPTVPLKDQKKLAQTTRPQVGRGLLRAAETAVRLLRLASLLGKVVLVTLADVPWVELTCNSSYPMVGQGLKELGVKVVYAKEVCKDRLRQLCDVDSELFWSKIKGEAIAREAQEFYSQYEGQSWKNIISIGDSQFERLGTMVVASEYMREKGLFAERDEVDDQEFKVRTKTLKMVGEPTLEELVCEMDMVHRWLPLMVAKDCSLDVILDDLDNPAQVREIEEMLSKKETPDVSRVDLARNAGQDGEWAQTDIAPDSSSSSAVMIRRGA